MADPRRTFVATFEALGYRPLLTSALAIVCATIETAVAWFALSFVLQLAMAGSAKDHSATFALVLSCILGRAAVKTLYAWISASLLSEFERYARQRLISAHLRAHWSAISEDRHSELQTLLLMLVEKSSLAVFGIIDIIANATTCLLLGAVALVIAPFTSGALILIAVLALIALLPIGTVVERYTRRARDLVIRSSNEVGLAALFHREARAFGVIEPLQNRFDALFSELAEARKRQVFSRHVLPVLYANVAIATLAGGVYLVKLAVPAGAFDSKWSILILLRALYSGQVAMRGWTGIAVFIPYFDQVFERFKDLEAAEIRSGDAPAHFERLSLADVSVQYGERTIVEGVNFEIASGEIVGLIGPSGAGKTTLANVMLGLLEPASGVVLLNRRPLREYSRASFAALIGFVAQECRLLDSTVADNIRFYRDLPDSAVVQAAEQAGIAEHIRSLPEGFDTPAGDLGSKLSGGQRQRLALARALAASPRLLVLDEPTSALDDQSESVISQTLKEVKESGAAVLVIAHRASTMAICDRLVEVRDGRVNRKPQLNPAGPGG